METKNCPKNPQKYYCEACDYYTSDTKDLKKHNATRKHILRTTVTTLETSGHGFIANEMNKKLDYHCDKCNYKCSNKTNYMKHLSTNKHINNNNVTNKHICDVCNKEYLHRSGYYKHKKICKVLETKPELTNELREPDMKPPAITVDLILEVLKQNKELQNFLMAQHNASIEQNNKLVELVKTNAGGTINTNCNNNNNNQFNLQFFLNETCKNAMNIQDFVNSIQLTTQDFENTGKLGYVDGITKIIINKLSSVDTTSRPMHCTDVKRETLYIKDENVWEKEDDNKTKFKKVITQIANKNLRQLNTWKDEHPDCVHLDTQDNIAFRKYYRVAVGGDTHEDDDKFAEKIKRNVLKEIVVDKS